MSVVTCGFLLKKNDLIEKRAVSYSTGSVNHTSQLADVLIAGSLVDAFDIQFQLNKSLKLITWLEKLICNSS